MPSLVKQRARPRQRTRQAVFAAVGSANASSLAGSATISFTAFGAVGGLPVDINAALSLPFVVTGAAADLEGGAVTSLVGFTSILFDASGTATNLLDTATLIAYIDAGLAAASTLRAEKLAALAAAVTAAEKDVAASDLQYVDQVIRELTRARALAVLYGDI